MNTKELAKNIRAKALQMVSKAKASHIGGALSMADILAVLYGKIMRFNVKDSKCAFRDRFVLSKGHNGVALYATLSELKIIGNEVLETYYQNGSKLSGHISHKDVPGVEFSTGSLGQGINFAVGLALAAKMDNKKHNVYVIVGDGECNEGSIWEAALFANHFALDNLTVIIDHNKLQSINTCTKTLDPICLKTKWQAFGWRTIDIDGHNHEQLEKAFLEKTLSNKPKCIVAHTIKGKGVSFMEHNNLWHYRDPQGEFLETAIAEVTNNA